jgi:hypothetical protein
MCPWNFAYTSSGQSSYRQAGWVISKKLQPR